MFTSCQSHYKSQHILSLKIFAIFIFYCGKKIRNWHGSVWKEIIKSEFRSDWQSKARLLRNYFTNAYWNHTLDAVKSALTLWPWWDEFHYLKQSFESETALKQQLELLVIYGILENIDWNAPLYIIINYLPSVLSTVHMALIFQQQINRIPFSAPAPKKFVFKKLYIGSIEVWKLF